MPLTETMTQAATTEARASVTESGKARRPPVDLADVPRDGAVFEETDVPVRYLFAYLDEGYNLYTFLKYFPSVGMEQAVKVLDAKVKANGIVHSNREIVSGTPIFKGTRVPIYILFEFLARGEDIEEFVDCFPTVSREQAVEALKLAKNALESVAYETASR